jgi:hypothetical protein
MAPYWLLLDIHDLAKFAAVTFLAGCAWVAFVGREIANHCSTAETSASGESAPSGAGVWDVEPTTPSGSGQSEQGPQPCALSTPGR